MTTTTEFHPSRPHKASAGRRRRYRTQLPHRLHQIVPGAATILVTSVLWDDGDGSELHYHLVIRDGDGQQIRPHADEREDIVTALQKAFPQANWQRAQTWHWRGNQLIAWRPVDPSDLRGWLS